MFHVLVRYSVCSIETADFFSFEIKGFPVETHLFLNFWNENAFHSVCIGVFPRSISIPKSLLKCIAAFLSLFLDQPSCLALIGFGDRIFQSVKNHFNKPHLVNHCPTFSQEDLDKCLSIPSAKILDRYDYRSILDFLLLKLRLAQDHDWLLNLPDLHKVILHFLLDLLVTPFIICFILSFMLFHFFSDSLSFHS